MSYHIAIPSYRRAKICNNRTLATLQKMKIDPERITVFVVEEDLAEYENTLNPYWYGRLVIGAKGLIQQREFIENFYKPGTHIVSLDDDIEEIDLSLTEYRCLDDFFESAFEECRKRGSYIWGVYPTYNPFFRMNNPVFRVNDPFFTVKRRPVTYTLSLIIGAFYGYINREDNPQIELTREGNKEDVERSLMYYERDGIVIRYNTIGFKTKYFGDDGGGLGTLNDRLDIMARASHAINQKYPTVTRIKVRRNGLHEIVFKK